MAACPSGHASMFGVMRGPDVTASRTPLHVYREEASAIADQTRRSIWVWVITVDVLTALVPAPTENRFEVWLDVCFSFLAAFLALLHTVVAVADQVRM